MGAAVALLALTVAVIAAVPANASDLGQQELAANHAFWSKYGVPPATQKRLAAKLASRHALDAALHSGAPVKRVTSHTAQEIETISTYDDGSIAVAGVDVPAVVIQSPQGETPASNPAGPATGIKSCTEAVYSVVAQYRGCNVWFQDAAQVNFSFTTDFDINAGAYDTILRKGTGNSVKCFFGTCSQFGFSHWIQTETATQSAYDTWSIEQQTPVLGSTTLLLTLVVGKNTYSVHD